MRLEMVRHGGRNCVVVRLLKYMRPPNLGDEVVQKEGELMKQYDPIAKVETVWMNTKRGFLSPSWLEELARTYISTDSP